MSFLNQQENRDQWREARDIANAVYETNWATQEQMARVRQALQLLLRDGEVERSGFMFSEWRSTQQHLREPAVP